MTITGVYTQSLSISLTYSVRQTVVSSGQPSISQAAGAQQASPAADSVTLSPRASAPTMPESGSGAHAAAPAPPSPATPAEGQGSAPSSRVTRRADVLLTVLDADKDGAISEQEFTEGAMALLRRSGARHHHRRVHGEGHDEHRAWSERKTARLERKLERLFDRIDVDGDGGVGKDELTSALAKVTRGGQGRCEPRGECGPASTAAVTTVTSVTISVAVQQYTAVAAEARPTETSRSESHSA